MKKTILKQSRLLVMLFVLLSWACSNDDDVVEITTAEKLIGTWTTSDVNVAASVGGQSITDYLVDVVGLSPTEAAAQNAIFEALLVSELTGSLTFNADNTYTTNFGGDTGGGTWSLSSDEKTLTLVDGTETVVVTIVSITGSLLNASITDTINEDLDNDPGTPEVAILVLADITMVQ